MTRQRLVAALRAVTISGALLAVVALAAPLGAQDASEDNDGFAAAKGRVTFRSYCATCHGASGTGNGTVARYLNVEPADLTGIASRYGEFPEERIRAIIDGREEVLAHGDREMPIWGSIFRDPLVPSGTEEGPEARSARMIGELVAYLKTIQVE